MLNRRTLLARGTAVGSVAALSQLLPAWAYSGTLGIPPTLPTLSGQDIALTIGRSPFIVDGQNGQAITINGTVPAPLLHLRQGQTVRLAVTNTLEEDTSIHWHGVLLPFQMDGVPGVSFPGIRPRETFVYEFPVRQSGTFWYHSHSGLQEQLGHYGPIIIAPATPDPVTYDREHVIVLSDWSFMHPEKIMNQLKQEGGHLNRQNLTLSGLFRRHNPEQQMSFEERVMWAKMRMDPTDISDVTGATYTYLINGHGPQDNWTGLFRTGERVRLRVINASAMTVFNVRIPGLDMTVVQADGENVRPVDVAEFQISVAETYDVIVQPTEDRAFTIVAESVDRSGMGRATLAPRMGMSAPVPPLRPRPVLGMDDMGMAGMSEMSGMTGMNHGEMGSMGGMVGMNHGDMDMDMRNPANAPSGMKVGVGVDMIAPMPQDRTGHPGLGLTNVGHKVLTYRDLVALKPNPDPRPPSRAIQIHLTGNMERFMWSFNGQKFSEVVEPIRFARDERVRVTLVNDTMMQHPIHLHGHFFEVVNGNPGHHPLKHTVNVLPGSKVTFDLTADNPGDWAFHCHLLFHMHAGMFNVVTIRPLDGDPA
ncbi:CopA family copper-resistance protein [Skermanella aerolata]|uniref:copper resistance system multicopper oxidase n=1 Tax=Skermanella aerolata TaxID=393310 RepID=UPI003D22ED1A